MRVLYFVNSNNWSLANVSLLGSGEIHQLTLASSFSVVPEPSVLLLWLSGAVTVYASRRRNRKSNRHR